MKIGICFVIVMLNKIQYLGGDVRHLSGSERWLSEVEAHSILFVICHFDYAQ